MKFLYLILAVLVFFTGCKDNVEIKEDNNFNIVTSFYPIYVFTQNIVKDIPNVNVENMSSEHDGCLHEYQLTTSDMKLIEKADAFIINGAGLETFLEKVYTTKEDLEVIDSSENINFLLGKFSHENNEHIWLSITNAILQVKNIGVNLAELDSENSDLYLKNTDIYVKKLENLRNELRESLYEYEDIKIVTSHDAFPYFAEDFGVEIVSVIEKEEGTSPTVKEMQEVIDIIKTEEVKAIFIEEDASSKTADTIANETGVKVFELDTITGGNGDLADYENRMRDNINVIKESV